MAMAIPNLPKLLFIGKTNVVVYLLLCCALNTVTADSNAEEKVEQIFDNAIKQLVEQFAETESTHGGSQLPTVNLSLINAAHILKEIEETVANGFVAKCASSSFDLMGMHLVGYFNSWNFYDILTAMNERIYKHVQKGIDQLSEKQIKVVNSLGLKEHENQQSLLNPEVNAELFHLLLTFAIRMGFTIGQTALNAGRDAEEAQVHLHTFVHAQNCIEKIQQKLNYNSENSQWSHVVSFESEPIKKMIKLNFNPGPSWNGQHVQDNLGTIKWLVHNSVNFSIEGWINLLYWDIVTKSQQLFLCLAQLERASKTGSVGDNPVKRLIFEWERIDAKYDKTIGFCAMEKFGTNLANRLADVVTKTDYGKNNQEKLLHYSNLMNEQYEIHCGDKLKERMAQKGIKYEIVVANEELFLHYEDAIPYIELKPIKEYKKIAERFKHMLLLWKQKISKCYIKILGPVNVVKNCHIEDILQQIENCKKPTGIVGREICEFIQVSEFDMKGVWLMFRMEIETFGKLAKEIEKTWEQNKKLFKWYKYFSRSDKKKNVVNQIKEGKSSLKLGKDRILNNLNALLQQTNAIRWEKLECKFI